MADYFVVMDPRPKRGAYVAGFGDQSLAVSFAVAERDVGRELIVVDATTGEQVYPVEGIPSERAPRHSGMRFRPPSEDEASVPGDDDDR